MTREEHINEIAKDLCSKETICTCTDRNGRCVLPQKYARIIYDLGYRKDIEGKWEFDMYTARYGNPYRCSNCDEECADTYTYCPHCGTKMNKGGLI